MFSFLGAQGGGKHNCIAEIFVGIDKIRGEIFLNLYSFMYLYKFIERNLECFVSVERALQRLERRSAFKQLFTYRKSLPRELEIVPLSIAGACVIRIYLFGRETIWQSLIHPRLKMMHDRLDLGHA